LLRGTVLVPLRESAAYVARLSPGQAAALARPRALAAFKLRGRWYVRPNGYGRWLLESSKAKERETTMRQAVAKEGGGP
jgi:hypothetical protein